MNLKSELDIAKFVTESDVDNHLQVDQIELRLFKI